jgi:hypothetical protein
MEFGHLCVEPRQGFHAYSWANVSLRTPSGVPCKLWPPAHFTPDGVRAAATDPTINIAFLTEGIHQPEAVRKLRNPTHGSGWIVQVLPTVSECPTSFSNPTHGSGWIVQVLPTGSERDELFESQPRQWVGSRKPQLSESLVGWT